jgi:FlaA1/EpsC-like NDP-sugar epimerase
MQLTENRRGQAITVLHLCFSILNADIVALLFEKSIMLAKKKRNRLSGLILGSIETMINWPRQTKIFLMLSMDVFCVILASIIAMYLRVSHWNFFDQRLLILASLSLVSLLPVFFAMDVYRSIMRFSGSRSMGNLFKAVAIHTIILSFVLIVIRLPNIPRTLAIIEPLVFFILAISIRGLVRYLLTDFAHVLGSGSNDRRIVIYGAGGAGIKLAGLLGNIPEITLCAFVDDDRRLEKQRIDGILVHHSDKLVNLIDSYNPTEIVMALPSIDRNRRSEIVRYLEQFELKVQTLPNLASLVDGEWSVGDLREVDVEDLLGRDPVPPNELLLGRTIAGKCVLVTGAGGSIGSELCRQILRSRPSKLILCEMNEHSLYLIDQELTAQSQIEALHDIEIITEMGSILDRSSMRRLYRRWDPHTVFHAAAYKHVPLVEQNMISGMKNNIFGTFNAAVEAAAHNIDHFILISTDKAVRPTNIMGASKRICELILQALAQQGEQNGGNTRFAMVRFGNVLGSSGSVVPRFQQQILAGGPVTLTHRDITRYFMTIPEAAQLVIQAGSMAQGGEVYVLDMGKSVKIIDLARSMIRLTGRTERTAENPNGDIEIVEVGLRPGEKLFEELLIGENPQPTKHARIMQASEHFIEWPKLSAELELLEQHLERGDDIAALAILKSLVPEYHQPSYDQAEQA